VILSPEAFHTGHVSQLSAERSCLLHQGIGCMCPDGLESATAPFACTTYQQCTTDYESSRRTMPSCAAFESEARPCLRQFGPGARAVWEGVRPRRHFPVQVRRFPRSPCARPAGCRPARPVRSACQPRRRRSPRVPCASRAARATWNMAAERPRSLVDERRSARSRAEQANEDLHALWSRRSCLRSRFSFFFSCGCASASAMVCRMSLP
jgi:hypothetical protein